jgi:hypothetical protein
MFDLITVCEWRRLRHLVVRGYRIGDGGGDAIYIASCCSDFSNAQRWRWQEWEGREGSAQCKSRHGCKLKKLLQLNDDNEDTLINVDVFCVRRNMASASCKGTPNRSTHQNNLKTLTNTLIAS